MKIIKIISVMLLVSIFPLFGNGTKEAPKMEAKPMNEAPAMEKEKPMEKEMVEKNGPFITYKNMDQVMMIAESKPTVLFFKASWCPSCTSAAKKFEQDSAQLEGVNLVVVDYDKSGDLQVKYGVTYQHTFVQVSPKGDALVKWNGGATTELLAKIVKGDM